MASPDLKIYEYGMKSNDIVGTMMLVDSTTQVYTVSDGTPQTVLGAFDATGLVGGIYGYDSGYPLMLKLFAYDVVPDSTGRYDLKVSGKLGDMTAQRLDDGAFGITWQKRSWVGLTDADATVSVHPLPPMTSVSCKVVCGLATDYIDRASEGSYA